MVIVGIFGNSLILRDAVKAYEDTTSSAVLKQRSPVALWLAILLVIVLTVPLTILTIEASL